MAAALAIRQRAGIPFDHPIAIFDLALQLGIHLSFTRVSSMEGMWCKEKRAIVLTCLRPIGRRSFTCAHEIAHCHFNHGTRVDELLEYSIDDALSPEEYLANIVAAHLLMPFSSVSIALNYRKWDLSTLTATQAYSLANYFGVSYGALLSHLHYALRLIHRNLFERLIGISPKAIRSRISAELDATHLVLVDEFWRDRPVDLEVGDLVVLPQDTAVDGQLLDILRCGIDTDLIARAREPGVGYLTNTQRRPLLLRIMPKEFEGFAQYRFPTDTNVYLSASWGS